MIWPFRRRSRQPAPLDTTGPATVYPQRAGALPAPEWNGPTLITTVSPLLTPGQLHRGDGSGR
ncbi:hypothetical protein GA0070622_0871 [Micromonospora sediminicola]|uniref:Uncharacterized protein n=1 Tax=Micromonospora sediminicola TaxID=946078 RepID=A0A1A9B465_9ACTN|nr:hypothetical protein [Micromonospora sediminicola]SBT63903.1 hypothetical protein GA0070622_0871 [Micromonospora sediminicola]